MLHSRCKAVETALRSQIEDLRNEKEALTEAATAALDRERALNDRLFLALNPNAMRAIQASMQAAEQKAYGTAPARPMPAVTRRGNLATFHDPVAPQRARGENVRPALTPETERTPLTIVPPPAPQESA